MNIKKWREIHDVVQKYLRDFEQEQFMMEDSLFFPKDKDLSESRQKTEDIGERLIAARKMVELYERLLADIRKNRRVRGFLEKLVAEYGMPIKKARSTLNQDYGKRAFPAKLAKELVVLTEYARIARIYDVKAFENEILYRDYHLFFPDRRRGAPLKRPLVYAVKSASSQPDTAAKNYNTQGLRLKRLTVEKVWQGQV